MVFFDSEQAFNRWLQRMPLLEQINPVGGSACDAVEFPSIELYYVTSEYLIVRTGRSEGFCLIERCQAREKGNFTWFVNGEQVFARYLHWRGSSERVGGKTLDEAKKAFERYQSSSLFSQSGKRTRRLSS